MHQALFINNSIISTYATSQTCCQAYFRYGPSGKGSSPSDSFTCMVSFHEHATQANWLSGEGDGRASPRKLIGWRVASSRLSTANLPKACICRDWYLPPGQMSGCQAVLRGQLSGHKPEYKRRKQVAEIHEGAGGDG